MPGDFLTQSLLYPCQEKIPETGLKTAARVAKAVFDCGLARVDRPKDMEAFIHRHIYLPEYRALTWARIEQALTAARTLKSSAKE